MPGPGGGLRLEAEERNEEDKVDKVCFNLNVIIPGMKMMMTRN